MIRHAAIVVLLASPVIASTLPEKVSFSAQIRPLLKKRCMACHGGVKKASGVSFISRQEAMGKGKSGRLTVVPGDTDASELFRRVTSEDPDERMPPADKLPEGLSFAEIELLEKWIEEGASWTEHWSLEKPRQGEFPRVADEAWPRTGVDHFILARLEAQDLRPSREADRAQWLRRASFDLIGLPPSPEGLSRLLADTAPGAHAREVDRLLESPAFGERWASMWLDLARYADSQGYEKDGHRDAWAYRDWLIRSFNADMPFDEFTVKQLAGDLIQGGGLEDSIATAFHRNTQTNTEGGTDDEEFRVSAVIDRVNTTWLVWQATTFRCTQCHSHPYDSFRNEDFYRFYAFFNNSADADLGDDFPTLRVPKDPERFAEARALDQEIRAIRERLNAVGIEPAAGAWEPIAVSSVAGPESASFRFEENEVEVSGTVPHGSTYHAMGQVAGGRADGRVTAVRLDVLPRERDPRKLPEHGSVVSQLRVEIESADGERRAVKLAEVFAPSLAGPYDPWDSLAKGASGGGSYPKLDGPTWLVFALEEPLDVVAGAELHAHLSCRVSNAETKGAVVRRFRLSSSSSDVWGELVRSPRRKADRDRLEELSKTRTSIPSTSVPVMAERPKAARRVTRRFHRGNFLDKGDEVSPGVPSVMHPLPDDAKPDRLAMARWLVSPENPLTARVFVNRIWAELFGIGIVETLEDFGAAGESPSHPEMLDHLALRFRTEHRWRFKPLLRELVLSATYRQDNRATPEALARDAKNRLVSRGPRTRLTAEMVRDQALAVAGVLSTRMYGPSVMPPQPDGVWSVVYSGASWKVAKGADRHRRALYTYLRRTSPYPSFLTFDAPSREICVARRIPTNTPLQALVTLNDPVYVECAQALAKRMRAAGSALASQLDAGHRLATQRAPTQRTLDRLERLHAAVTDEYAAAPEEAKALAESPGDAALVIVASTLLNLDRALTK